MSFVKQEVATSNTNNTNEDKTISDHHGSGGDRDAVGVCTNINHDKQRIEPPPGLSGWLSQPDGCAKDRGQSDFRRSGFRNHHSKGFAVFGTDGADNSNQSRRSGCGTGSPGGGGRRCRRATGGDSSEGRSEVSRLADSGAKDKV